ncbi:polyprenyl glycosylphosphotransferase [Qipengyuania flava]|uniref:sugar transferase n=1 Tax=Qipengyuania flava TaxID=192812 RepID=UPI000B8C6304|nr:sugar transferase [Qipengyuania flava]ASP31039.1 polyprenyl glycosylphosphotransferase [Qipengyuania flava]
MNHPLPNHVQQFTRSGNTTRERIFALLRTNRVSFGGALLFAIVIPEIFHPVFARELPWTRPILPSEPSFYGSIVALVCAHVYLRKVGLLPFVQDKIAVVPAFLAAYATVFGLLFLALRNIGLYHSVVSFGVGIIWYLALAIYRSRTAAPRIAYFGSAILDERLTNSFVEWIPIFDNRLPDDVHGIVFDGHEPVTASHERLFSRAVLRGVPVYEADRVREMVSGRVHLRHRPEQVFGEILPGQPYLRIKRAIDLFFAIPAFILALPIMALVALLIRMESPGAAIFRQPRIGFRGRKFTCYKLRSMRSDVEGPQYTTDADPRITRIGAFIRKTRLDELPQILNIIKGDMSWIGPRPESVPLGRMYQKALPYYSYRHLVRPGITGWAAVRQGNVALTDAVRTKLEYDFYYLKYFSIWLDLVIVMMTIRTVLTGSGSK